MFRAVCTKSHKVVITPANVQILTEGAQVEEFLYKKGSTYDFGDPTNFRRTTCGGKNFRPLEPSGVPTSRDIALLRQKWLRLQTKAIKATQSENDAFDRYCEAEDARDAWKELLKGA